MNRWRDKESVVHIHNAVLFLHKQWEMQPETITLSKTSQTRQGHMSCIFSFARTRIFCRCVKLSASTEKRLRDYRRIVWGGSNKHGGNWAILKVCFLTHIWNPFQAEVSPCLTWVNKSMTPKTKQNHNYKCQSLQKAQHPWADWLFTFLMSLVLKEKKEHCFGQHALNHNSALLQSPPSLGLV